MLRPSLSDRRELGARRNGGRSVAGVYAPAFVERRRTRADPLGSTWAVSPEFMLRPSLSVLRCGRRAGAGLDVSPEFMLRPSLSAGSTGRAHPGYRVSPEFMLRPSLSALTSYPAMPAAYRVSPEFMLRPSLSGVALTADQHHTGQVSPEFMLRPSLSGSIRQVRCRSNKECRRSLCSGLR